MSGLPGVGKDHWIKHYLPDHPIVAIDQIRLDMGIPPSAPQGPVIQRARELARAFLGEKRSFVWNAPNLSRHVRGECVKLAREFHARVQDRLCGGAAGAAIRPEPLAAAQGARAGDRTDVGEVGGAGRDRGASDRVCGDVI